MAFIMRLFVSLISLALLLGACQPAGNDYGFKVRNVQLHPGYMRILAQYDQNLSLSREAVEALEHGVPLTILLELELRDSRNLNLLVDESRVFEIRFLPLNEVYQLSGPGQNSIRSFPRLRHVLTELANSNVDFQTGPLAPGNYEFRSRIRLNNARLPAPMRLPALFSAEWKHDSEWSTWPFEINV
ncbi:MAG: hypothetical protein ACI9H8_001116 [Lysobacterales bacterium]|jgi:hypothetical protein